MMTHHSVMASSLRNKVLKIDAFCDFWCDIEFNSKTDIFRDVASFITNQFDSGAHRAPQVDTKYQPAAQRTQAKSACTILNSLFPETNSHNKS